MAKKIAKSSKLDIHKECTELGCPFCGELGKLIIMRGHNGQCVIIQCDNDKCLVNPSTHMFDGKNAEQDCRKAWEKRATRLRRRRNV